MRLIVIFLCGWCSALAGCRDNPSDAVSRAPGARAPRTAPESGVPPAPDCNTLEGRRYRIVFSPSGAASFDDTLVFAGYRVFCRRTIQSAIPPPQYQCTPQADTALWFEGVESARGAGELIWKGQVRSSTVEGLLQWTAGDGPERQLPFSGTLVR